LRAHSSVRPDNDRSYGASRFVEIPIFDVPLSPDEQALYDRGAIMEMYEPTEHSGHSISHITAVADNHGRHARKVYNPEPVLSLVFGMEDGGPAREEERA
jgi:hypothetical protein